MIVVVKKPEVVYSEDFVERSSILDRIRKNRGQFAGSAQQNPPGLPAFLTTSGVDRTQKVSATQLLLI